MGRFDFLRICAAVSLSVGTVFLVGCHGGGTAVPQLATQNPSQNPTLPGSLQKTATSDSTASQIMIGVDLRDIVHYKAQGSQEAKTILAKMTDTPEAFFPIGVRFLKNGPTLDAASQKNSVYGVEAATENVNSDGTKSVVVNAFYNSEDQGFNFRVFDVVLDKDAKKVTQVSMEREVPASQTMFTVKIGLLQRKVVLEDAEFGFKKIYPVGLGGFDEGTTVPGQTLALTPRFKAAVLEKSAAEFSRTTPDFYAGRPFVRISNGAGNYTPFGLHYSITPNLIRGFVSHGCIRMRDKDVYELYYLVTQSSQGEMPLEMRYRLKDEADSPFPLDNSNYEVIENFGTADNPETRRDKDDLLIMNEKQGAPPQGGFIDNLTQSFNHYFNLQ